MQIFYLVRDCGFREDVVQVFGLWINQKQDDESFVMTPCIAAVTMADTVLMFRNVNPDIDMNHVNNFINNDHITIDLSTEWRMFNVVSVEEFDAMKAAGPGPVDNKEEATEDNKYVAEEITDD